MSNLRFQWHQAHRIFPVVYQEALLIANDKIPTTTFAMRIARRLRLAGQTANTVDGNKIVMAEVAAILVTRQLPQTERDSLTKFLATNRLQLGYIVQIADPPVWGCVQISSTSFSALETISK